MKKLKLKIMGRFGSPMAMNPDEITIQFPYMGDRTLIKTLTRGGITVLDQVKGELEVNLDDFEVQGLNPGERQSFVAIITQGSKKTRVTFPEALTVDTINDRKSIR